MVNASHAAGRPDSGGPLFCARQFILGTALFVSSVLAMTHSQVTKAATQVTTKPYELCAAVQAKPFEPVRIQRVTDGDTVVLEDGRKVRIIGINAPELSKKSEGKLRGEAQAASALIQQMISESTDAALVLGDDSKDRYGRVLGHIVFDRTRSLASELILHGLAAATAVSPNTRCAEHNLRMETQARTKGLGIWQYPNNPWFAKSTGVKSIQGFHILTGLVEDVRKGKRYWEFQLANGILIRAKHSLLSSKDATDLQQKTVEVRGWFGRHDGFTSVRLHHRTNLTIQP